MKSSEDSKKRPGDKSKSNSGGRQRRERQRKMQGRPKLRPSLQVEAHGEEGEEAQGLGAMRLVEPHLVDMWGSAASEELVEEAQVVRQEAAAASGEVRVAEVEAWVEKEALCPVSAPHPWANRVVSICNGTCCN